MGVPVGKRRESSVEFENAYFRVHDDAVKLSYNYFGAKDGYRETNLAYIESVKTEVFTTIFAIGREIRIANSIFPTCRIEREERRVSQDRAIGLCFDLLTKYQLAMKTLKASDNKYVEEIKNIRHLINCLKSWRTSDNTRFKDFG